MPEVELDVPFQGAEENLQLPKVNFVASLLGEKAATVEAIPVVSTEMEHKILVLHPGESLDYSTLEKWGFESVEDGYGDDGNSFLWHNKESRDTVIIEPIKSDQGEADRYEAKQKQADQNQSDRDKPVRGEVVRFLKKHFNPDDNFESRENLSDCGYQQDTYYSDQMNHEKWQNHDGDYLICAPSASTVIRFQDGGRSGGGF